MSEMKDLVLHKITIKMVIAPDGTEQVQYKTSDKDLLPLLGMLAFTQHALWEDISGGEVGS